MRTLPRERTAVLAALLAAALALPACGDVAPRGASPGAPGKAGAAAGPAAGEAGRAGPLEVVATVGMVADLARRVAGPHAQVLALMGPGTDPHLYKARESDIRALARADLVLYAGLHLEGRLGVVLERLGRRRPVVAVSEALEPSRLRADEGGTDAFDPHVWFDVSLWSLAAGRVAEALAAADPGHAADYARNLSDLQRDLAALHEEVRAGMAAIPRERRVLVTAHDAFGYFGRAYDVEVRGIQGFSTLDEAGVQDLNDLVDFLVRRGVKAVFVEASVPRKNVEALVEGARARGHDLRVGGELFSDAMGAAGTPEGTYAGMVRHNLKTITEALR